jgi:hypothetical protein
LENPGVDELKYARVPEAPEGTGEGELMTVKLRYKEPDGDVSKPLNVGVLDTRTAYANASADFKFAAAVAEFGMLLRGSRYKGQAFYDAAEQLARRLLAIREKIHAPDDPAVATAADLLADICAAQGKGEEQQRLRERAKAIRGQMPTAGEPSAPGRPRAAPAAAPAAVPEAIPRTVQVAAAERPARVDPIAAPNSSDVATSDLVERAEELERQASVVPARPPVASSEAVPDSPRPWSKIAVAVGVVLLVGGGGLALMTRGEASDRRPPSVGTLRAPKRSAPVLPAARVEKITRATDDSIRARADSVARTADVKASAFGKPRG